MPRASRVDVAGVPQHLMVRGNNRCNLFEDDNDRTAFLRFLRHAAGASDCSVHAYVLMTNHVHVLATGNAPGSVSRFVQSTGRRYAHYANRVHQRSGTLFEGRFRSSLVGSERYLFTCMRYIELNPVRAGMVPGPGDYDWSSHRENSGLRPFGWLVPRPEYLALGHEAGARAAAYRALFAQSEQPGELEAIRDGLRKGSPFGSADFIEHVERVLGRPAHTIPRGRPPRQRKGI